MQKGKKNKAKKNSDFGAPDKGKADHNTAVTVAAFSVMAAAVTGLSPHVVDVIAGRSQQPSPAVVIQVNSNERNGCGVVAVNPDEPPPKLLEDVYSATLISATGETKLDLHLSWQQAADLSKRFAAAARNVDAEELNRRAKANVKAAGGHLKLEGMQRTLSASLVVVNRAPQTLPAPINEPTQEPVPPRKAGATTIGGDAAYSTDMVTVEYRAARHKPVKISVKRTLLGFLLADSVSLTPNFENELEQVKTIVIAEKEGFTRTLAP